MSALSILAEECELLNDSKYRSYITQIEKALKSFDSTSEWADLISALGKLNKVLLAHVKYSVIPKRVTIGKRLAQCLHPALPSGVHMKALETYDIIFKCIGTERLAQDLFIYSAGLFPLLTHAAMNVKPVLLMIYEKHFVNLRQRIKPGLNGLLLGLLPGLEEGSEFYDRTNALLEDFAEGTELSYFYTCLWECIHSCPSVRLPATIYLLTHFNRKQTMEDQLHMIGLNINLMIEAICSAVQDTSVLVQRSMLDFLLLAFPLHNSQLTHSDMAKVVKYAINVLLRRDMSLNRRFYAWLLGTSTTSVSAHAENSEVTELSYFEKYSQDLLIQALKFKLTEKQDGESTGSSSVKSAVLRPFRILISLLDKPEIGPVILESVLLSIFRCLHREFELSKSKLPTQSSKKTKGETNAYDELLKTANLLFGTFEPYFIWDYAARMFDLSCSNSGKKSLRRQSSSVSRHSVTHEESVSVGELSQLIAFLLEIVSLETFSETQTEHLPNLLCSIITSLTEYCDKLSDSDVITSLQLCTKILSKVQPTMTTSGSHDLSCDESHDVVEKVEVNISGEVSSQKAEAVKPLSVEEAMEINRNLKKAESEKDSNNINGKEIVLDSPDSDKSSGLQAGIPKNRKHDHNTKKNEEPVRNSETCSSSHATGFQSRKHSKQNQSQNLMQKCTDCFQHFFHELVTKKFLKDENLAETCFGSIVTSQTGYKNYDSAEEDIFNSCDNNDNSVCDRKIIFENENEESLTTFSTACQLLVEFASFPMYGVDVRLTEKHVSKAEHSTVPLWVQDLVTCCCFVHNFYMQSSAVSTMLDLIILTQSVQVEDRPDSTGNHTGSDHMTLQILPTLHWEDLKFLSEHTHFFKISAEILWSFLDERMPQYHQTTVKLFYMLHQAAPSSWICENVIGNQLIHDTQSVQTDAYKKFSVLWHLTRNKKTDVIPGKPLRTFNRSMFVILDSLKDETSPLKVIASTWLTHVIQQGDINRVMEPLLQMLLHPDTARVSVQHVNVHQPRKVCLSESSEENLEANIYAISSEGGNVIYHVSSTKEAPKKQFTDELKSYALTVLGEKGAHTAPVRSRSEQELHFDKVDPSNVSLRINPFGSENSLDALTLDLGLSPSLKDNTVNKAKRLDRKTCVKEGISFSGTEESQKGETTGDDTDGNESVSDSAENIAMNIIDEIVQNVTRGNELSSVSGSTESVKDAVKPQRKKMPERTDSINSFTAADELLNSVQRQRVDSPTPSEKDIAMFQEVDKDSTNIHTLHMHMLLYIQKYDYQRTLYALSTLKAMLVACPRPMVTALVTTNISTLRSTQLAKLQLLLARHRKSVFGKNFFGEIPADVMSNYRSSMFIEILISVCLYFVRGYYPNLMMSKMSCEELLGNKQVHILATETLTMMMSEIVSLMRDSGKNFVSYISDLFQRCKVQKALLHCILAEIYNGRRKLDKDQFGQKITEAIIAFNEDGIDSSANEAFQIKLLDLLLVMIMLEEQIRKFQSVPETTLASEWDRLKVNYQPSLKNVRYNMGHPIVQQGMFVSGVLSALKQTHTSHMHRHWVTMVTSALPYMGKYLPGIVMTVVSQLCRNIEALAAHYESDGKSSSSRLEKIPPDHVLTMLSGLMTLCHYCLLDNMSPVSIGQQAPSNTDTSSSTTSVNTNILTNLFHVFNPVGSKEASPQRDLGAMSPVLEARNSILSVMPRIIACMAALWRAINIVEKQEESPFLTMGSPKVVRQYILEFISPISLPHGLHLLGAIAVAWNDRRKKLPVKNSRKVLPTPCEDQLLLVDLVGAIKVFPTDTLVQTVKEVLSNPPSSELSRTKKGVPLEVNMLQFFYAYVQRTSANQLVDSWSSLSTLLKESLQLNLVAPGQFLLLLILNEFVQKTPSMVDKKKREIQEIAQKLLEAVSNIAGSSLEQTTWLRKNYAVKPGPQSDEPEEGNQPDDESVVMEKRVVELEPTSVNSADSKYSVQALAALAEITAPLLDVIYTSDEKDKVPPFLTTLLYNIFPYLKSHTTNNLPSLRVASQFLSSISSYQYTRKAWRREALDLLLDNSFFQMDMESIGYWVTIVDNLMTHDKTTYKDLMARVSMTQTGSLNLFSNKEQEIDQKAGMLKRLAFTVFCSEADQYQKSIPEIQEKLAESLRIPQAPSVMAQVFLCFRVLMLRVSPQHLTSMWPTIITELIHVFLQIEQELSTETEEFVEISETVTQVQRIAALDSSWAHLGNGLNAHNNPSWMQLYLSACKLLDMCLALPADTVPQFQLYRWAFIGGAAAGEGDDDIGEEDRKKKKDTRGKQKQFKPHIIRLAKLLNTKLKGDIPMMKMVPGRPLLMFTHLRSLQELQPFFNTLCLANQTDNLLLAARQLGASGSGNQSNALTNGHAGMKTSLQLESKDLIGRGMPKSKSTPTFPVSQSPKSETALTDNKSSQQFIEEVLMRDFLEPMT
ncbi:protein dopey-1-like isoform X3 [Mercenaria mercenaria]|uniref:protein dopey-1-like isoform X3 n=1 Tax=Mercenaria mercenaria TaxID=6596 RepID=UPI00234F337A|nr:protein dopey-1-like isoform X3 [Mercenaria mercenaria]